MGKKRQHLSILLFREGRNGKGTASGAAEKVSIRIRVCLQAYRKLQKISPVLAAEVALYLKRSPRTTGRFRHNMHSNPHVAVVGAGAFGGWTALYLLRRRARVTLVDAWGPGNSRSSSGGETRIIRGTYGPSQPYTKMAARAMRLWKEHEARWDRRLLHRTGVLWMATSGDDQFERSSLPMLRDAGIAYEELSGRELARRWTQILSLIHI